LGDHRQKLLKEAGITKEEAILTYIDWHIISNINKLSEEFIREFEDSVHWSAIFAQQNLSDDFLIEFQETLDWSSYFMNAQSSFCIMKKFITKTDSSYFQYFKVSHFDSHQKNEIQRILNFKNIFRKDEFKFEKTT
jgi:hypothetical protein